MYFYRVVVFVVVTLFPSLFVSCGKKLHKEGSLQSQGLSSLEENALRHKRDRAKEIQAKFFDVPVPIGFQYLTDEKTVHAHLMVYEGVLPLDKVRLFYLQEMERLGWKIDEASAGQEVLFWCSKMNKQCAVSIRVDQVKTYIYLFIKTKISESIKRSWFD